MFRALVPVTALLVSVAFLLVGNGLQNTLLPLRGEAADFGSLSLGIMGSAYYLGFVAGCVLGPWIVARAGHIRTFAAMVSLVSCAVLAHAMIVAPVPWWVLRAGAGVCFAVLFMVIESWLNDKATNESRGLVFGAYIVVTLSMITAGQLLLLLDRQDSILLYLAASILVSLAAVPVALTRAEAPPPITAAKLQLRRLVRASPVGAVGCFVVGLTNGAFWSLGPVFAARLAPGVTQAADDYQASYAAQFMSVAVIAGAIGQLPLGRLSDKVDRRLVIIGGAGCAAVAGVVLMVAAMTSPGLMLPAVAAFGLFGFTIYSIAVAHVNDFVAREEFVQVAGGLLLIWAAGAVIGPLVASALMEAFTPALLFGFTAGVHVVLAGFTAYRLSRRAAPATEDKANYDEAALVSQTFAPIDMLPAQDGEKT